MAQGVPCQSRNKLEPASGNRTDFSRSARWVAGFTLIEILVAMLISAFLLTGVISIALSSRQSYQTQENLNRIQENLRVMADLLQRSLSMAESLHPDSNAERLIVLYSGGPGVVDCLGNLATSGTVTNHFYVRNQSLYCGVAWPEQPGSEQPLVDGITDLTVQYGVDTTGSGEVADYVTAPENWDAVISARLTLHLSATAPTSEVVLTVGMRPRILSRLLPFGRDNPPERQQTPEN